MIITQEEQIKVLKEVIKCNKRRIKSVKEAKRRNDGVANLFALYKICN